MSEKLGLVGRKIGMTRIFTEDGVSIPVTVLEVSNNRITQVKTVETDGYNAVQVAFGSKKPSRVSKPLKGQFEKAGVEAGSVLKEFHVEEDKISEMKVGQTLSIDMFSEGQKVDVTGTTIGKGFAGAIKRHGNKSLRASHGTGPVARQPGSMGTISDPSRIFKGKGMAGHMGAERVTIQNLEVVKVDAENNLIAIKGAIPGPKGGLVIVTDSKKA